MATIKVFSVNGVKELNCFDTLDEVDYLSSEIADESEEDEDIVDF